LRKSWTRTSRRGRPCGPALAAAAGPRGAVYGFVVIETAVKTPVAVVAVYTLKNTLIVTEEEPPT
jgi:hypothetical protein